jgi:elongation factor 2
MVVKNSPSPTEAQRYRVPKIWKGKIDSEVSQGMLNCDDRAPTVMCITNAQIDPNVGLIATGRLFSGSVEEGRHVYLVEARKKHVVKEVSMYMGAFREVVSQITAGNIVALTGLDLARAGETLVDVAFKDFMVPFERMKYVSEPVITMAIEPRNPEDMLRLREAMNRLSIEDPNLTVTVDKWTGEYLLSGMGELHLETAMKFLRDYSGGVELATSDPMADYRETATEKGLIVVAESPDKQNRFWVQVEPHDDKTKHAEKDRIEDTWAVDEQQNIFLNSTNEIKHLDYARDMILSGFNWACKTGPLCEQPLRNVKVRLMNAEINEDPILCRSTQITRTVSRAIFGSFLTAKPVLLEPVYRIEVSTSPQWFGICANIITSRRGRIQAAESRGTLTMITGYVPVAEMLGSSAEMRSATSGHVVWQSTFENWEKVPDSVAAEIVRRIRTRRGLPPEIPKLDKFAARA